MDMVDNLIDGVYANLTRINPETLSVTAREFLKALREEIKLRRNIDKNLGNLVVKTLIKFHNDTGESLQSLVTEIVTVSFFVIDPHRQYFYRVAEFLLFGIIFTTMTITEDDAEATDLIIQTLIAIFSNPIYEFTQTERTQLIHLTARIEGYLEVLNKFSHRFTSRLALIHKSLQEGLLQSLEICNATAEETNQAKNQQDFLLDRVIGGFTFFFYLAWPMFNITSHAFIKWLNSKTGLEFWPEKREKNF